MQYKNGLLFGKFIAYHQGHQYYINKFANSCKRLNLILCENTPTDKVPLKIRKKWLEEDLNSGGLKNVKDKINLITLNENKILPNPKCIKEWCSDVQNLFKINKIDVIFGNDIYVKKYAEILKCNYFIPDVERSKYNISSTKIYSNGLKYYDLLAEVSKPHFNKTVLFIGPESTGKTTLVKRLSEYFKGEYIEEYHRIYKLESIEKFKRKPAEWDEKDFEKSAKKHDEMIKSALKNPCKLLFIDTDAMITEMYLENDLNGKSDYLNSLASEQKFDLILYLDYKQTCWVDDGVRFLGAVNERERVSKIIKQKLRDYGREYVILENNEGYEKRFDNVVQIIKEKFKLL